MLTVHCEVLSSAQIFNYSVRLIVELVAVRIK